MVNLYNANVEKDQLNTIDNLSEILKSFNNISAKQIVSGGDFNFCLGSLLLSQGENPKLKKSVPKMIGPKNTFEKIYFSATS